MGGYDINRYAGFGDRDVVHQSWDGVTLWDVIEHMETPDRFLKGLGTDYLFIATPNLEPGQPLEGWKHYKPDEHQHYFSEKSLRTMLDRCGYTVEEVNHDEGALRDPDHPKAIITLVARRK